MAQTTPENQQQPAPSATPAKTGTKAKKATEQPAALPDEQATPRQNPENKEPAPDRDADRDKGKEEHYDMTEVAPVVTHHQITVGGKLLSTRRRQAGFPLSGLMAKSKPKCFSSPTRLRASRARVVR